MSFCLAPPARKIMLSLLMLSTCPLAFAMPDAERTAATAHRDAPVPVAVTIAAPVDAAPGVRETPRWAIRTGDVTLRAALARWAEQAGWQLLWEVPVDYAVDADSVVDGTFEQAVAQVASSMQGAEMPLRVIFYNGNKVLRIVSEGAKS